VDEREHTVRHLRLAGGAEDGSRGQLGGPRLGPLQERVAEGLDVRGDRAEEGGAAGGGDRGERLEGVLGRPRRRLDLLGGGLRELGVEGRTRGRVLPAEADRAFTGLAEAVRFAPVSLLMGYGFSGTTKGSR
jgi:hypothetical protein